MEVKLLAFAQARGTLGFGERMMECGREETPRMIVGRMIVGLDVGGWRVAVDREYADWDEPIGDTKELAFIPPVSGG